MEDSIPSNAIGVNVRYPIAYGYHWAEGPNPGDGPTSCDEFLISLELEDGVTRPPNSFPIGGDSQMQELFGYYTCKYLISDLPLNKPIKVTVTVPNNREAWLAGTLAQPPPGQQRVIQNGVQNTMLSVTQPSAKLTYEMIYAPIPPR